MSSDPSVPIGAAVAILLRGIFSRFSAPADAKSSPPARPAAATKPAPECDKERWMLLSTENGVETWMDFQTGLTETRPVKAPAKPAHTPILQAARRSLQEAKLLFQEYDAQRLTAGFKETHGRYHVFLNVEEPARRFSVWTAYGSKAPVERIPAVEELVARINERLDTGDVSVNRESGEIFVRALCVLGDEELAMATVPNMMRFVVETADRWHPAVMRVLYGGMNAKQVLGEEGVW